MVGAYACGFNALTIFKENYSPEDTLMMVLTDIRLDSAGVKRFTKMMEGKGPYGVVGEISIKGTRGGPSGGVMVVYRTDHLYVGKGAHYCTLIPGRALVVKFEVLADESEFDLAAIYMPCRGTTGAEAVWERLADWVTARRGLILAGDMNASLAKADERRTPSDRALRELVEEGDVVQIGGGETTYGRADTELDYWLASPDMVTRWIGCGTVLQLWPVSPLARIVTTYYSLLTTYCLLLTTYYLLLTTHYLLLTTHLLTRRVLARILPCGIERTSGSRPSHSLTPHAYTLHCGVFHFARLGVEHLACHGAQYPGAQL